MYRQVQARLLSNARECILPMSADGNSPDLLVHRAITPEYRPRGLVDFSKSITAWRKKLQTGE